MSFPKIIYRHKYAPHGRRFACVEQAKGFTSWRGWVESPDDFPKKRLRTFLKTSGQAWWANWKWLVEGIVLILGLLLTALAGFLLRGTTANPTKNTGV